MKILTPSLSPPHPSSCPQLIYIPDGARPTAGAMICIIAVANLNYFRPHKTNVLFWLTELTFVASAFKYITALMIESSAHNPDATEEDIDTVGSLLIGIEIFTIIRYPVPGYCIL